MITTEISFLAFLHRSVFLHKIILLSYQKKMKNSFVLFNIQLKLACLKVLFYIKFLVIQFFFFLHLIWFTFWFLA